MLLDKNPRLKNLLHGQKVLLTGSGGGIGFEAAQAFAYMGALVILAEIDERKGVNAENAINKAYGPAAAKFFPVDLADEQAVLRLCDSIQDQYGCPDVIFNNATITPMGAIENVSMQDWDKSYRVNFKAPLLLTQRFLPLMKQRSRGTLVFVSSSGASPYMGAYEVFKTSQVELSNTLAMELENTDIHSYTIGPGLVKTETAMNAIQIVAQNMGMGTDEFYAMNRSHILDAESAGAGFALSILKAADYHGQEIGSIQVLMDFDLAEPEFSEPEQSSRAISDSRKETLKKICSTFEEQYTGWCAMNIFERQWVFRDLKKNLGFSAEQALEKLKALYTQSQRGNTPLPTPDRAFFEKLKGYWEHQLKLLQGYQKNKQKLEEQSRIISGWIADIEEFLA